jgi:hypothetical protein
MEIYREIVLLVQQSILSRFPGCLSRQQCSSVPKSGFLIVGGAGDAPDKLKCCWQHNKKLL